MAESCANSPPSQTTRTVWNSLRARRKSRGTSRPSTLRTFLPGCTRPNSAAGMALPATRPTSASETGHPNNGIRHSN
ncbi:Uncharacterised protein [Mycobacterium tuberculosis]|nr:Uncharacterised protein [Mycobacterium tuberculosis]